MKAAFGMISTALVSTLVAACAGAPLENDADDAVNTAETEQAVSSSLKLHLKLNEGSWSGYSLINSGDPTITATLPHPTWVSWVPAGNPNCIMGSCLYLKGSGGVGWVGGISTNLGLTGVPTTGAIYPFGRVVDPSMSYSAWIVLDSYQLSGDYWIFSAGNGNGDFSIGYEVTTQSSQYTLWLRYGGNEVGSRYFLVPGVRYHLTAIFDTATRTAIAYVNGRELMRATDLGVASSTTANPIVVGFSQAYSTNLMMRGYVDEVRVYKGVLGPTEISPIACDDGNPWTADAFAKDAQGNPLNDCTHTQLQCLAASDCADATCTIKDCVNNVCVASSVKPDGASCGSKNGQVCDCGRCCGGGVNCPAVMCNL